MSGVGMLHFRLVKIHSNPPILYYGFNDQINEGHMHVASHMHTLQCVIFKNEAALYWKVYSYYQTHLCTNIKRQ